MKEEKDIERCYDCNAPAKFRAGVAPCCGRHLGYMIKMIIEAGMVKWQTR